MRKRFYKERKIMEKFKKLSRESIPKAKLLRNSMRAFLVGGSICVIGEVIGNLGRGMGIARDNVGTFTTIIMIFLGAFLTGVGVYDKLAIFAGAGTVVPITGFANAVVAPAIEYKKEGFIFGVSGKIFTIAGPVLVYGIGTSVLIGIIYYLKMIL